MPRPKHAAAGPRVACACPAAGGRDSAKGAWCAPDRKAPPCPSLPWSQASDPPPRTTANLFPAPLPGPAGPPARAPRTARRPPGPAASPGGAAPACPPAASACRAPQGRRRHLGSALGGMPAGYVRRWGRGRGRRGRGGAQEEGAWVGGSGARCGGRMAGVARLRAGGASRGGAARPGRAHAARAWPSVRDADGALE